MSFPFSAAVASRERNKLKWSIPMLVTTPIVGSTSRIGRSSDPGPPPAEISTTQKRSADLQLSTVWAT